MGRDNAKTREVLSLDMVMIAPNQNNNRCSETTSVFSLIIFVVFFIAHPLTGFSKTPEFDGNSAFTFLYKQCAMGPRIPGSETHASAVKDFQDWFDRCGGSVTLQEFNADVHVSYKSGSETQELEGINVIARFGPVGRPDYLLCAHYDTRPWADKDEDPENRMTPISGANDGASGVAVLLEMARIFAAEPPPLTIEIVLFDIEDSGVSGNNESYCLGSAYYAKHYAGSAPPGAVLLDMIGDTDLEIPIEYFSFAYAKDWTNYMFDLAEKVGSEAFVDDIGVPMYDDHVNLIRNGIPTVNFIDFDYPYWHTLEDTPDKCSPESLEQVGRVLVELIYGN
ncbi:MAG: M28 family peptidase [Candidatus Electryonea clarkiae]|nr:M28 family peptidase [Candidatus Electryonea clarkiae]MDP8287398.1 M28 family peptidase [Candidatus Electryonea clarkiae]